MATGWGLLGTRLASDHAGATADFELVDLADYALPLLDEAIPAARLPGRQPACRIGSSSVMIGPGSHSPT